MTIKKPSTLWKRDSSHYIEMICSSYLTAFVNSVCPDHLTGDFRNTMCSTHLHRIH